MRASHVHWSACARVMLLLAFLAMACANEPGGTSGTGADVTVTDYGDGTVTVENGIVSIVIDTSAAKLDSVRYRRPNGGEPAAREMLKGKGQFWFGGFRLGGPTCTYRLATDPHANGGERADVMLLSQSASNGVFEVHFSMLRGSPGFYTTAIQTHRKQDAACEVGAWGFLTRVPTDFQWVVVGPSRDFSIGPMSTKGVRIPDAPHEVTVLLDGGKQGEFEDKFIYGQDNADAHAWGWCSVGKGGANIGVWLMTRMEFGDGGPLKRDAAASDDHGLNNAMLTGEIGMGSDGFMSEGEEWSKTCGPCFYYLNHVPTTVTDAAEAARLLRQDALAQAAAEQRAWPYAWFTHPDFVPAAGRGTVTGRIVIRDLGDPNASPTGTWVGVEQQPRTNNGTHDFQKWLKPYQYWVQTGTDGSFAIPHVIAGNQYTLWAYGPGAVGTFLSQHQIGGDPPLECDLPEKPFAVTVTAGMTTDLGIVMWVPRRVGATVFALGTPDRKSAEFRHGEDFWSPAVAPKVGFPTPIWGGQVYFPSDFPAGMTYTIGQSQWATDWNYVLPSAPDPSGAFQACTGTICFDLAEAPAAQALASIYLACAGDDGGHVVLSVNDTDLGTLAGATAAPNPLVGSQGIPFAHGTGGFNPAYSDDSCAHFSDHGPFSDERVIFPGKVLHAGRNTLAITMNARSGTAYVMVDHLRLELSGYVPPAPTRVIAYAGNGRVMVCWPVVPGAIGYDILRADGDDGAFTPLPVALSSPVAGCGIRRMTYVDITAVVGRRYRYEVHSIGATGSSAASGSSQSVIPTSAALASVPNEPSGLTVTSSGHRQVTLAWHASTGADFYRIFRTTLHRNGVGGTYPLRTIMLDDAVIGTGYTDATPSDGTIYGYEITATNAMGWSANSAMVTAIPQPPAPAFAPAALVGTWTKTRNGPGITLSWSPVTGAVGYVIYRSTRGDGRFLWPTDFVTTIVETTYTDKNDPHHNGKADDTHLSPASAYDYQVSAVNTAGVSSPATVHIERRNE